MRHEFRIASAICLVVGCGTEHKPVVKSSQAPDAGALEVRPGAVQLAPAATQQFTWSPSTVQVTWSVAEAGGGSINGTGSYTAPGYSGVFHVVATSTTNTSVSAQAIVTVDSGIRIVATSPASAYACEAVALSATVSGSGDTGIVWSAPATCGTVSSAGVFISARGSGTCIVTAQSHADPAQVSGITVNVAPERVLSVVVVPASATVGPARTQTFAANVTTACGTFPAGT